MRQDKAPDQFATSPKPAPRNPGRAEPKQVVLDSTRPAPRMRALVEKTGTQAIATGAGFTVVSFATVVFDTVGLFTANKFTIPAMGRITSSWRLQGMVTWAGDAAGTRRQLRLRKNGTTALRTVDMNPVANAQSEQIDYLINDPSNGDFFELLVSHDAGHDVNVITDSQFSIIHLW